MMLRACTAVSLSCVLTAAALGTVKGPASAQPSVTKTTKTSKSTVSFDKEMLVGPKAAKQQGKRLAPPVGMTPESLAATLGAKNLATFDRANPEQRAELELLDRMMAQPARSVEGAGEGVIPCTHTTDG